MARKARKGRRLPARDSKGRFKATSRAKRQKSTKRRKR